MNLTKCTFTSENFEKNPHLWIYRTEFLAIFRENQKTCNPHPFYSFFAPVFCFDNVWKI